MSDLRHEFAARPVSIVDCPGSKQIEVSVHGMAEAVGRRSGFDLAEADTPTCWTMSMNHDTTLVFANSRRQAENTADRMNSEQAWHAVCGEDDGVAVGNGVVSDQVRRTVRSWPITEVCRTRCGVRSRGELKAGKVAGAGWVQARWSWGSISGASIWWCNLQSPKTVTQGLATYRKGWTQCR